MNEHNPLHGDADEDSDLLLHGAAAAMSHHAVGQYQTPFIIGDCADGYTTDGASAHTSTFVSAPSIISEGFATLSRPIVVLDFVWNLAFIVVAVVVLLSTLKERPSTPLRLWLLGYALQCAFHVGFICIEYRRADFRWLPPLGTHRRLMKRLESANTIISSIWWVLGFYWLVVGGQALLQESPHLYWLTVVFLVFDVFFVIFCIGMAFIFLCALFCFIPIMAMIYAVVLRPRGASEDVIRNLPKHRYRRVTSLDGYDNFKNGNFGACLEVSNNGCSSCELFLHDDDSMEKKYAPSHATTIFIVVASADGFR
ncbi:hypothetical protein SAY86_010366 [Trapa natans]|uniref:RING-type E3 ubiquitin transferase n=1 Tax=Trapa natans TaxID=22666 RepID=A0AAN7LSW6_TRANT|nr:hypothetical protein SAY86_010366 [Trapa natans]